MNEHILWVLRAFRDEVLFIPGRVAAMGFFIILFLIPVVTSHPYLLRIVVIASIFAIFAASWDVLSGFTGQINLGQALFFGSGGYVAALLNIHFDLPPVISIPIGAVAAVLVGMIAAMPALRLRGFYLSMVTLAYPIILTGVLYVFPKYTGGEIGLFGLDRLSTSRVYDYYIVIIMMIICLFAMFKFTSPETKIIRTGVILHAIREDEITTRISGINTIKYKVLAFAVSGFFAGIAGGLYAFYIRVVGPSTLDLFLSFQVILWTIFGGIGTIFGAVTGVFILYPLVELMHLIPGGDKVGSITFALILIFTLLFMPEGFTVWIRDKAEIKCPRCKEINMITRKACTACLAPLHKKIKGGTIASEMEDK